MIVYTHMLVTRTHARVGGSYGAGQEGQSVGEVPNTQSFQTTARNIGVHVSREKKIGYFTIQLIRHSFKSDYSRKRFLQMYVAARCKKIR